MRRHTQIIGLILIGLLLSLPANSHVNAQGGPYEGLDVVFVIDQSESMGRVSGGLEANDPLGLRFYAPWYAMYWMGEDRLLVHPDASFRMALVNFGSNAEPFVFDANSNTPHWVEIAPASRDAWNAISNDLTQKIDAMREDFSGRDLIQTDFISALSGVRQVFNELPSGDNRLRVIILLTDGQPSPDSLSPHMGRVEQIAESYFPEPDYRFYVIGMIARDPYWPAVGPYWEEVTNDPCRPPAVCPDERKDRSSQVKTNTEVGKRFQEILQDLTSELEVPDNVIVVDQDIVPGPLTVPPFLKSIQFTYFKSDPGEHLLLTDPAGPVDLTGGGVKIEGQGGPIEVVFISNPLPGEWSVATDPPGKDVKITMRQIFAVSDLISPQGPQVQYVPVEVKYRLLDDQRNALPSYADQTYRLMVTATIGLDGQTWPIQLNAQANNEYSSEFTPVATGEHTINVRAVSQDSAGNTVVVFDNPIGSFSVSPATLALLDSPAKWSQYKEGVLRFELRDARGFPVVTSAPLQITAQVTGDDASTDIPVLRQQDGTYQALYTPQKTGIHKLHVNAIVSDVSGVEHTVVDEDVLEFNVLPTTLVKVRLVKPMTPDETKMLDTGLLPNNRNPLVVEAKLVDDNDNTIDPKTIFIQDPAGAIELVVTDADRNDLSELLHLQLSTNGIYRAETDKLGIGEFDLSVKATGALREDYQYADTEDSVHVVRIRHPMHVPILAGLIALAVLVTTGTSAWLVRRRNLRQHPCQGKIMIVDMYSSKKFEANLDDYRANRIEIKSKEINPITHVTRIVTTCSTKQDSQARRIHLKVWLDNDKTEAINQSFGQNQEVKLPGYNFWLLKDPSDELYLRDRSFGSEAEGFSSAHTLE